MRNRKCPLLTILNVLLLDFRVPLTQVDTLRIVVAPMTEHHTGTVIGVKAGRKPLVPPRTREVLRNLTMGSQADILPPTRVHTPLCHRNRLVHHQPTRVTSASLTTIPFRHLQHPEPLINFLPPTTHQHRILRIHLHRQVPMGTHILRHISTPMPRRLDLTSHSLNRQMLRTHRLRFISTAANQYSRPVWRPLRTQVQRSKVSPQLLILHSRRRKAQLQRRRSRLCNPTHTANRAIAGTATSWVRRADRGVRTGAITPQAPSSERTMGLVEAEGGVEAVVRTTASTTDLLGNEIRR